MKAEILEIVTNKKEKKKKPKETNKLVAVCAVVNTKLYFIYPWNGGYAIMRKMAQTHATA